MEWKKRIRAGFRVTKNVLINSKAELIMIFFAFGYHMPGTFVENLLIQKVCLQMKYPKAYCLSSQINTTLEEHTQGVASKYMLYQNLVLQLPSLIVSLFLGRWSDKYGRKFILIMSNAGSALSLILYWLNYVFMDWPPIFIVLSAIPAGISGEYSGFMLGIFGYIKDLHSANSVSVRVATVDGVESFCAQVGTFISNALFLRYGYPAVFWCCAAMMLAGIVCTAVFVKDEKFIKEKPCLVIRDYFKTTGFITSFATTFKKREGHLRAYVLGVMTTAFIVLTISSGGGEIMFLYARLLLNWNVIRMNLFGAVQLAGQTIGCFIIFPAFVHIFHWSDITLGIIGLVTTMAYNLIVAFTRNSTILFCAAVLSILKMLTTVTFRSIITKCIPYNEMGSVFSIYAILQAGTGNLGEIIGQQIYLHTYKYSPGAYFIFAASSFIISIAIYAWIYVDLKRKNITLEKLYG